MGLMTKNSIRATSKCRHKAFAGWGVFAVLALASAWTTEAPADNNHGKNKHDNDPPTVVLAGVQGNHLPESASVFFDRPGIEKVMELMDARRFAVQSLIVRLNFVLQDHEKKKDYDLNGVYLGDKEGNIRLQIKYGDRLILDMGIHGETVDLHLPRKDRYYRGSRKQLMNAEDCELSIFAIAGNMHDLFFPRAWTRDAIDRFQMKSEKEQAIIDVIERPGLKTRLARRFKINPDLPVADAVEVFNRAEKTIGTITYSDYCLTPEKQDDGKQAPPYPGRVLLTPVSAKRCLRMDVTKLRIDAPITTEKFEVEVPDDLKVTDLGEHLDSGRSLWE